MDFAARMILELLDSCAAAFTFPMLDNGYFYLAATRLSLYRSEVDWGMVIETFGFSPRMGLPDTNLYSFASRLEDRDPPDQYLNPTAYKNYLRNNPHNEFRYVFPIAKGDWQDPWNDEFVDEEAAGLFLRGALVRLPDLKRV